MKKKILFISGTRADYGKIKPVINIFSNNKKFDVHIFVTGMHMLKKYGSTFEQIKQENYNKTKISLNDNHKGAINLNSILINTLKQFSAYVEKIKPDLIIVHGDRVEALAGSIVGSLNNYLVCHVEGGEISGNIDEHIRHAISKLSHIHFVANLKARNNLIRLGESKKSVFITGSPDIDIMNSKFLPSIKEVKDRYNINFKKYALAILHPENENKKIFLEKCKIFYNTLVLTKKKYVVIYPNNDKGSKVIEQLQNKYLKKNKNFRIIRSLRFEYFLTLLKKAEFIIGNSSVGIREAPFYGIPTINIGNRQLNRYTNDSIINCEFNENQILKKIKNVESAIFPKSKEFGSGNSAQIIKKIIEKKNIWNISKQKQLIVQD